MSRRNQKVKGWEEAVFILLLDISVGDGELRIGAEALKIILWWKILSNLFRQIFWKRAMHSTSWKFSLYFVHIFRTDWNFLTLLSSLIQVSIEAFWNSYTWKLKHLRMRKLHYSLLHIIYKFLKMIWIWKLHWGYILVNEIGQWCYQLDHATFCKYMFWFVNFALPYCQVCYV